MRSLPKIFPWLLSVLCSWLILTSPAWANDSAPTPPSASALFETHCAGCHVGGGNIVRRRKTLKQKALLRNGVDSVTAVAQLINHGKGAMSAYQDRLTADEIDQLAQYVWQQSQNNWQ
ncbi:MAG: c-type cytochrome [Leptolyngbya sp. SIOISBB]|nr:c-type cytochrome [Leptolyngbya sp. SIOISBB]